MQRPKNNEEINERIVTLRADNYEWEDIAFSVNDNFNTDFTANAVRNRYNRHIAKKALSGDTTEKKKYDVIDVGWVQHYTFKFRDKYYRIPVSSIDELFTEYSAYGNNKSWREMMDQYDLREDEWSAICSRLGLRKHSHVISNHTIENSSEEAKDAIIDIAMSKRLDTLSDKFKNSHEKEFKERAKRAIDFQTKTEELLAHVKVATLHMKPQEFPEIQIIKSTKNSIPVVMFSDIHLGKIHTPQVVDRLRTIATYINRMPEQEIIVVCLGDIVETAAQGGMHPWQIEYGTDASYWYGHDLFRNVHETFSQFLYTCAGTNKIIHSKWITGNHDRSTQERNFDLHNTWGLSLYFCLEQTFRDHPNVTVDYFSDKWQEFVQTFDLGNIRYILRHGHVAGGKPIAEIILAHGDQKKYNVVVNGHWHSAKGKQSRVRTGQFDEGNGYLQVQLPWVAWEGTYCRDLMLFSEPGYMLLRENEHGTVDMELRRLK